MPSPLLAACFAVIPAGCQLWRGRALARFADDPAFPERLMASRRYVSLPFAACIPLVIAMSPGSSWWTLPLLAVSYAAAAFPLRKAIYDDTWSLWTYLAVTLKFWAAVYGFWLSLLWLPLFSWGEHAWLGASLAALVLIAWNHWYADILRFAAGTKPVSDLDLQQRFSALAHAMAVPLPRFEQIPLHGGAIANALALPSLRRSTVLFTDTILKFERDEVAAICAHELAHLEHYNRRRLTRINAVTIALIVSGAFVVPVVHAVAPDVGAVAQMLWVFALLAALVLRARDRQKNETASDLRAVAITGDPEALVRALTRLHAVARLPRRWDPEIERTATHPSLARRIQAIRAAAGAAAPMADAVRLDSPDGATAATLFADRLEVTEGASASHNLRYDSLADLRVEAARSGATRLVAVDQAGRRWNVSLAPADVVRAQAALDRVDMNLARPAAASNPSAVFGRLVAGISVVIAMTAIQLSVVIAAFLAFAQPAAPLLAASGMASIVGAILTWRDVAPVASEPQWLLAIVMFGCGSVMLALAHRRRRDSVEGPARKLVAALGMLALMAWIPAIVHADGSVRLHQTVFDRPSVTTLAAALGAALWLLPSRVSRCASAIALAVALSFGIVGTGAFLEAFAHDPFLAPAEPLLVRPFTGEPLAQFSIDFDAHAVELSPGGRSIAVAAEDDDEELMYHVGAIDGHLTPISADAAVFADDQRLVVFNQQSDTPFVGEIAVAAPSPVQRKRDVPRLYSSRLTIDRESKRWRLLGINGSRSLVRVEGTVGSTAVAETRWALPAADNPVFSPLAATGDQAIVMERRYDTRVWRLTGWWRLAGLVDPLRSDSRLWVIRRDGAVEIASSQLDLDCDGLLANGRPVCVSFDGRRSRFFAVDADARRLIALAAVPGNFRLYGQPSGGWIGGFHGRERLVVHPETRDALRLPAGTYIRSISAIDGFISTVQWVGRTSSVRVYRVD